MNIKFGCDCADCRTSKNYLKTLLLWLFFTVIFGFVAGIVFWR